MVAQGDRGLAERRDGKVRWRKERLKKDMQLIISHREEDTRQEWLELAKSLTALFQRKKYKTLSLQVTR